MWMGWEVLHREARIGEAMKSHTRAGQVKLRGKKGKLLSCRCCAVTDLRVRHAKRNIAYAPEDDLPNVAELHQRLDAKSSMDCE